MKNSTSQPIIATPYCGLNAFMTPVYQKGKQWIFIGIYQLQGAMPDT